MKKLIVIFIFVNIALMSAAGPKVKIAISKGQASKNNNQYYEWLRKSDKNIEILEFYDNNIDSVVKIFTEQCSGLLLSGGADVNPYYYNMPKDTGVCEIDFKRDTLEFKLIKIALEKKIPILGVCRGLQILNVAMGGTLIADIPTMYSTSTKHRCVDYKNCFHQVNIEKKSKLRSITKQTKGLVNTNHHQAIGKLAPELKVTALSEDGIIEAIEWKAPYQRQFLLAVQWHPERLFENKKLSVPIVKEFIKYVKKYHKNRFIKKK